jgi:hypothetical protein
MFALNMSSTMRGSKASSGNAVFEKDSKFVNYDLGQEDIEDRCSMAGVDLTNVAERETSRLAR